MGQGLSPENGCAHSPKAGGNLLPALLLLLLFGLCGCAAVPPYPPGKALGGDGAPSAGPAASPGIPGPDSLSAKLVLEILAGSGRMGGRAKAVYRSVAASLALKPYSRYRLDLQALPGMTAASFLWTDTGWTALDFEGERFSQGDGDSIRLGLPGRPPLAVPITPLFAFLHGDFLLRGREASLPSQAGAPPFRFEADPETGRIRRMQDTAGAFRLDFSDYAGHRGRPLPGKVRVFLAGEEILRIKVKSVRDNPPLGLRTFRLRIPEGFRERPVL